MKKLDKEKKLHFTKTGGIRLKRYLDEMPGMPLQDLWEDISPINSQAAERLGYPTQKPLALLERIIKASTNKGDIVLDAYCGCGTTVDAAHRLGRKWIGIDITYQSISVILKRFKDTYGKQILDEIELNGVPQDMASAKALANKKDDRVRKEFEKWAVLTYSDNTAIINEKKGADGGIDGIGYTIEGKGEAKKIIFSVKSGHVGVEMIRSLSHVVDKENAVMGILITLEEPTKPMKDEAKACGRYKNPLMPHAYDKIQVVTVKELIDGERLNVPLGAQVLKKAKKGEAKQEQAALGF